MYKKPIKPATEPGVSAVKGKNVLPEVALAAIVSYKKQKEIDDFMRFFLEALERNSIWLNDVVDKQTNFRCAMMVGAGPNRFQLQEIIYPPNENKVKLEVEHQDSEDYDKVAIAALLRLSSFEINHFIKYVKTHLCDNPILKDDLFKGKAMGISFAVLRPYTEKHYRVMERIVIGSSIKNLEPIKKRRRDERSIPRSPLKKARRVA